MDVALEAAMYFQGTELFDKLVNVVRYIRQEGSYETQAILDSGYAKVVEQHTGINSQLQINHNGIFGHNAYVVLPDMTDDHPFNKPKTVEGYFNFINFRGRTHTGEQMLDMLDTPPKASVDMQKMKVGGLWSSVRCDVVIEHKLINDFQFTEEEIAAILLHELGHIYTYFLFIDTNTTGAYLSMATSRAITGIEDPKKKEYYLKKAAPRLGIDAGKLERILEAPKDGEILLFRHYVTTHAQNTSNPIYDLRGMEQVADSFAIKHGAGSHLASAISRLYGIYGHKSTQGWTRYILAEAAKFVFLILTIIYLNPVISMLLILYSIPSMSIDVYDPPEKRVRLLRQGLITDLKNETNPVRKKEITDSIERIKEVESKLQDKFTLAQLFWESIPGTNSYNIRKQEESSKQLEELIMNDLHYYSAKFEQLGER